MSVWRLSPEMELAHVWGADTYAASGGEMHGGRWWARQDSNLRASGYEPGALPLSYGPCAMSLTALLHRRCGMADPSHAR